MNTKSIPLGVNKWLTVNYSDKIVSTHYGEHVAYGTREVTYDNVQEAAQQGYPTGSDGVWLSLIHHEILHNILPPFILDEESFVLQHESGKKLHRYALRLHEEALVISFQRWMNTGDKDPILYTYSNSYLNLLKERLQTIMEQLEK